MFNKVYKVQAPPKGILTAVNPKHETHERKVKLTGSIWKYQAEDQFAIATASLTIKEYIQTSKFKARRARLIFLL